MRWTVNARYSAHLKLPGFELDAHRSRCDAPLSRGGASHSSVLAECSRILRHSDHAGSGGKARPTSFRRLGRGPDALRVGDRRSTFAGVVATMRARTARQERIAQRIGDRPRPSSTATAGPSAISVIVERFCLSSGCFICGRLGRLLLCFQ